MQRPGHLPQRATAVLLAALGIWALQDAAAWRDVRSAERAGAAGDLPTLIDRAREVDRAPAASRARALEAYGLSLTPGRTPEAIAAYRRAIEAEPHRAYLRRDLGALLLQSGERLQARRQFQAALRLDPRIQLPAGVVLRQP